MKRRVCRISSLISVLRSPDPVNERLRAWALVNRWARLGRWLSPGFTWRGVLPADLPCSQFCVRLKRSLHPAALYQTLWAGRERVRVSLPEYGSGADIPAGPLIVYLLAI